MPPEDDDELRPGDAVTAAQYAQAVGLDSSAVRRWTTRGYLDDEGTRHHLKPSGSIWLRGRWVNVYLWNDLSAAEKATRARAKLRRNLFLAIDQVRHRPHLDHRARNQAA